MLLCGNGSYDSNSVKSVKNRLKLIKQKKHDPALLPVCRQFVRCNVERSRREVKEMRGGSAMILLISIAHTILCSRSIGYVISVTDIVTPAGVTMR